MKCERNGSVGDRGVLWGYGETGARSDLAGDGMCHAHDTQTMAGDFACREFRGKDSLVKRCAIRVVLCSDAGVIWGDWGWGVFFADGPRSNALDIEEIPQVVFCKQFLGGRVYAIGEGKKPTNAVCIRWRDARCWWQGWDRVRMGLFLFFLGRGWWVCDRM